MMIASLQRFQFTISVYHSGMNNVKAILFIILLVGIVWYAATLVKPRTVTTAKQPTTALFATVQNTSHCQERGGLPDP